MKKLMLCLIVLLTGCTESFRATPVNIKIATSMCESNDGLANITKADFQTEWESCGYRCSRPTGRKTYNTVFTCNNGAEFAHTTTE